MIGLVKRFWQDDRGAVTVDWLVLTSGVVALAVLAYVGAKEQTILFSASVGDKIAAEADN
ncbi:hypothetical protein [Lacimonas salitolerans]|uniref:Flp pilus assembly protein, pilin Flp n=1 Tax=Lacimonas salitolerans TaxID=1323750 RepID=A0ABW4ECN4_9RHOB